jgi:hypothetical protein
MSILYFPAVRGMEGSHVAEAPAHIDRRAG